MGKNFSENFAIPLSFYILKLLTMWDYFSSGSRRVTSQKYSFRVFVQQKSKVFFLLQNTNFSIDLPSRAVTMRMMMMTHHGQRGRSIYDELKSSLNCIKIKINSFLFLNLIRMLAPARTTTKWNYRIRESAKRIKYKANRTQ